MLEQLGIIGIENLEGFDDLKADLYKKYGMDEVFGGADFPEPLQLQSADVMPDSHDRELMRNLMHENARVMLPFVDAAINAAYKNNPIFNGVVDRESLAQLVDCAMRRARAAGVDICATGRHGHERTQCDQLLRALTGVMILTELLIWRRI